MKVNGEPTRSIREKADNNLIVEVIDQRWLPHELVWEELRTVEDAARAIKDMHVRGAPLIGITAAYGLYLAALGIGNSADFDSQLQAASRQLAETRPTAVNLEWALQQQLLAISGLQSPAEKTARLRTNAARLADEDAEMCRKIGVHGMDLIRQAAEKKKGQPLNVLTHCNAGWLACVDYGTATSPLYLAHNEGIPIHVWVDETRPRNQGARLTAWELGQHGIPHTVIPDNTGGHLMQHGMVDLVIVGTDRTTPTGDVANKIGTYLKALAAQDNELPFYVALPSSTIDWNLYDGFSIPIEQRHPEEVTHIWGLDEESGKTRQVKLTPEGSPAANYGFDVTPARLVTALITERGVCTANPNGIYGLFPEFAPLA